MQMRDLGKSGLKIAPILSATPVTQLTEILPSASISLSSDDMAARAI